MPRRLLCGHPEWWWLEVCRILAVSIIQTLADPLGMGGLGVRKVPIDDLRTHAALRASRRQTGLVTAVYW